MCGSEIALAVRKCSICGGPLATNNRLGICQQTAECRKVNKRIRNRARNRVRGAVSLPACSVCGARLRKGEVCIKTERCRDAALELLFLVSRET